MNLAAVPMWNKQQFYLFGHISTSHTGGQPYSDTSHYGECYMVQASTRYWDIKIGTKMNLLTLERLQGTNKNSSLINFRSFQTISKIVLLLQGTQTQIDMAQGVNSYPSSFTFDCKENVKKSRFDVRERERERERDCFKIVSR